MEVFTTSRILGYSLSLNDYRDFEAGNEPIWPGFKNPYKHLAEQPNPLRHRLPLVKENPSFAQIGLILAVEKFSREIIGSAGFHNFPNERGMIEVGFGIVSEKQNQGFGQELLLAMWDMICMRPDVNILRYTVSPQNEPSLHIIGKLGFELVGQQVDPEDGIELIYEQAVEQFLKNRNFT
jgi:RimJ/RimL family protein N-acetyltransferase